MELYLIISCFLIVIFIFVVWIFWSSFIGAGFEPTSKELVKKMLDMAEVDSTDVVYDLGSGDGRIVMESVNSYSARAVGIEADPIRVIWSRMFIYINGIRGRSKIKWANFFNEDVSEASVVTLFLGYKANQKLKEKLLDELKPGSRIVSYIWTFDGWQPVKINRSDRLYLYIIAGDQELGSSIDQMI